MLRRLHFIAVLLVLAALVGVAVGSSGPTEQPLAVTSAPASGRSTEERQAAEQIAADERPAAKRPAGNRPATEPLPALDAGFPDEPVAFAARLARTTERLRDAVGAWRSSGTDARIPEDVELLALHQQRLYRRLAQDRAYARAVVRRLPASVRPEARDVLAAMNALRVLNAPQPGQRRPRIRIGEPQAPDRLRAHYRRAWRTFRVGPPLLAAVNFVESAFGRLRNNSHAGAQGPMQFIPATWTAYGAGGDVRDPRDAIMGAARYLHANGAPGDEARALYHYNPSSLYVTAVSRYTAAIRRDWRAYYGLYAWQVYIAGRRITGPGR